MTLPRKLLLMVVMLIILCIFSIIYGEYVWAAVFGMGAVALSIKCYNLIVEEIIIYYLFQHNKTLGYDDIVNLFGKKAKSALERLKRKKAVIESNGQIVLTLESYKFSFTRWKP